MRNSPQRGAGLLAGSLAHANLESGTTAPKGVHELFEAQVARTPLAPAAVFMGETLSYYELNCRANALAHELIRKGVRSDVPVCIFLDRSHEMLIAMLAVLKARGAYVPLDPSNPRDRLALIVVDSKAPFIITRSGMEPSLPPNDCELILVDSMAEQANSMQSNPDFHGDPTDLAYILYTSGSTGKPKGVEIEHRSLINFLLSMQKEPGIGPDDSILAVSTVSFDISILELLLPLTVGARTIIASQDEACNARRLEALLEDATIMQATPATYRLLLDSGWTGNSRLKLLCGGEAMQRRFADQLLERCGSLWNMYGPTETTVWSTIHQVTSGSIAVPIGKPVSNTNIYVLDSSLKKVAEGEVGELYIGGLGLARGYRFLHEMTREKFIANPFGEGRIYRTGDLARFREDGLLECLGRTDHQVKIRGFRIELGEIEHVLEGVPGVGSVVVSAVEDPVGEKRLVAYIVPKPGMRCEFAAIRKLVQDRLPNYMWPSAYVSLERLPLTPNGKIDRKALPSPDWARPALTSQSSPPKGETEIILAGIWSNVLEMETIGRDDNFFELGGDSMGIIRMLQELEPHHFGLKVQDVYKAPTIAELAALIQNSSLTSSSAA